MDLQLIAIYIMFLWIISAFVTILDKLAAKRGDYRIPEKTLLWLGFLGGAGMMLTVMKLIRHKTQKKKFMISLPIFLVLHVLAFGLYYYFRYVR